LRQRRRPRHERERRHRQRLRPRFDPTRAHGLGPEPVFHYGHGLAVGTGGTPRAGLALRWDSTAFGWSGAAARGNSGSAVRVNTGMQAADDLTHLVVDTTWLPSYIAGTRMNRILQIAGRPLANSPLC
jgi:hypothetical protein